jgi:hypothetical protein
LLDFVVSAAVISPHLFSIFNFSLPAGMEMKCSPQRLFIVFGLMELGLGFGGAGG